jgi:lipopolysaccharide/colanic/teichoic acid biosynthesis glycosyltransferase
MSWRRTLDETCRRMLDVMASALGLLLISPLLATIALLIHLDSPGPVLHRGTRVGRGGRPFRVFKFRTMVAQADTIGPGITRGKDPRVTAAGHFLRRTKLDELPQLVNVLRGDMSLVGPRPEDPYYVGFYTREQRQVLSVRPGITSLASLRFRDEQSLLEQDDWEHRYMEEIMPAKLEIELDYLKRRCVWSDLIVIAQTILSLAR